MQGRQIGTLGAAALAERRTEHDSTLLDVGTGDGRFPLRHAREHPRTLCVGLDAVSDNLEPSASRAARKPARGGAPNLLFVIASLEDPPAELGGFADRLTVLYPWSALLRGLVAPDPRMLDSLVMLAAPGARIDLLLNSSVFEQAGYAERLELPALDEPYLERVLVPAYRTAGIHVESYRWLRDEEPPYRTTWGQRLTRSSQRETLEICARREAS